jgi:DNA-binding HxlR family transcriptional regulator
LMDDSREMLMGCAMNDEAVEAGLDRGASTCPANLALALLGQKWTMMIVLSLVPGKARHSELRARLGGLNSTTLSQRLKALSDQGIVTRCVLSDIPPWVEYSLTEKGRELAEIILILDRWGRRWMI